VASALGIGPGVLEGLGAGWPAPLPAAPAPLFRADAPAAEAVQGDLELLADALSSEPVGDWDEVDALFRGG
jgi:hypothetical protein